MLSMIVKMTLVTTLYVLVTMAVWKWVRSGRITGGKKLCIGLIFGLCSVMSTHFGVDYSHMMLNVRDLGPLAAGLFFDPISGIIAGLIGGLERYIAGTYFGVGSYTRIACSVSTCLAGFLSAVLYYKVFKRKKPAAVYAFFMGAVMEVFHMYVVLITHRSDMDMAYYVVKTCSWPMIIFTGLGLAVCSIMLRVLAGEWKNPFRHIRKEEVPVSQKFQLWLFAVTMVILIANMVFSFLLQSQVAEQDARDSILNVSEDIRATYAKLDSSLDGVYAYAEDTVLTNVRAMAESVEQAGGFDAVDEAYLENMRSLYALEAVTLVNRDGTAVKSAGTSPVYAALLSDVLDGSADSQSAQASNTRIAAGAVCGEGMVQAVINPEAIKAALNVSDIAEVLSFFHVGSKGTFDLIEVSGVVRFGSHSDQMMSAREYQCLREAKDGEFFRETLFGVDSLCRVERLDKVATLLVQMPMSEVYANRDAQLYETGFADILLFTVIYVLISMLVQQIVVNNLNMVNRSLSKITGGDLNEVVNVRESSEFASLSDDINQTVDVLKGYIDAAEKRVAQELEFARTIQDSALPKNFTFPRQDFELFASMDPAKEVGGDFYDFFFVDQNRLALVIADVSGKGIPAALFMMRAKTAIRGLAELGRKPSEILFKANNTLCEGNEAEMFVTVWLGIVDLTTGLMQCANAGHEYPALMRAGGEFELFKDKHGLALAAMEDMRFREYEIQLNPGDRLFVYTDGIPEAIDGNVEQYGADRLLSALNAVKLEPMTVILPAVRKNIADFVGGADQFDDITMVGFVYRGQNGGGADSEGNNT